MNKKSQNITQDPIIIKFRYSGYYDDKIEFDRLFAHHRVEYDEAFDAFMFGRKVRKNRIKCGYDH
ncbi:MAG: hypothetical protein LBP96_00575 [Bacteroidales bacterium]|jgi:hypothetical protein|nr:hypothetical protein [Bacteroidales bacterium]